MWYFVVRATNAENRTLLEVDVPLSQLWPTVDSLERDLREQGFLDPEEEILTRLVPLFEPASTRSEVQPCIRAPADLGDERYGIRFEEDPGDPPRPLQALSIWFCSTERAELCAVEIPSRLLFASVEEGLLRRVMRRQLATDTEKITYSVYLQGSGLVRASQTRRQSVTLMLLPAEPSQPEVEPVEREMSDRPSVEVTVTDRESLVKPERRSWQDYALRPVGSRQEGDLRILLNHGVIYQLDEQAWASLRRDAEVGGFLIGNVYEDEDRELFVDISDIVAAEQATGTFRDLRFNQEAWQQAFEEIRSRFPGKRRVGWYHTHLIGAERLQPVAEPYSGGRRVYRAVSTTFFSEADVFVHRNFFPEPWHVALVVDLKLRRILFYQWRAGKIVACPSYFVYDRRPKSGAGV